MPLGLIVLFTLVALVLFGAAQRVLDRMRLTDMQAIVLLGLIVAGSFIDIPVARGATNVTVNAGGIVLPAALAIYLLFKAGTPWERTRTVLAVLVTAGILIGLARWTDFGPHGGSVPMIVDPLWLFALIGGFVAYVLGRSRRGAFVAGVLGMILFQATDPFLGTSAASRPSTLALGGGGYFDAVVLAGIISVGLAELIGETRERLQGGPDPDRPEPLKRALSEPPSTTEGRDEGND